MPKTYYLLIAAVAGAAVLGLEVLAARAMAPALGSGPVAWSAVLAVALAALAVGNLVGGLLSDRVAPGGIVAWSLAVASACLVPLAEYYGPWIGWSAGRPLWLAALAAAAITQAVPLGMLGAVTPAILRIESSKGRWAGFVLAAGSTGGIAGALLTGLILLPQLGLTRSYLLAGVLLAASAVPIVCAQKRPLAALLLAASLILAGVCWFRYEPGRVVHSQFGQLEVRTSDDGRVLLIDGLPQTGLPQGLDQRRLQPGEALWHGYLLELALMVRPTAQSALVVGLGAGLAPRVLEAHGLQCHAVEIDPAVVEMAEKEFRFLGPTTVADGRSFLADSPKQWDLIFLDVSTSDRLAWHLFTVEAMDTIRDRLSPDGVLVIQFIGDDGPWSASLGRTVDTVFNESQMLAGAGQAGFVGPRWIFASRRGPVRLREEFLLPDSPTPWQPVHLSGEGRLLTDDHQPAQLDWARTALRWRQMVGAR